MNKEIVKAFKQQYVATHQLFVEQKFDQAIENIDVLLAMLPFEFPEPSPRRKGTRVLFINVEDAADEPAEKMEFVKGLPAFVIPENVQRFYDVDMPAYLNDWKFSMWTRAMELATDPAIRKKYLALTLAQANYCVAEFAHKEIWMDADVTMFVKYTNHIGWYAYLEEQDSAKLTAALEILEKGVEKSDWNTRKYIKNTKVRLLLKLGRKDEAFTIVKEAFEKYPDDADFLDLKTDEQYSTWIKERKAREEEAKQEKARAYQAFLQLVAEEQTAVTDQFDNPSHPLVLQHAAVLNMIKQRMVAAKLHLQYYDSDWKVADEESYKAELAFHKLSIEQLEQFEKEKGLRLPDELKVYLMEIGEGGRRYFSWEGITLPNDKQVERAKKPFPITADKIHHINHPWGIKAWVYPGDEDWIKAGVFKDAAEMEMLFGLPETAVISDGCIALPGSNDQEGLYLVMNGVFENEVWVNTLQYGADAGGCFGAASAQQYKFLQFIAESLLARQHNYDDSQGAWM